MDRLEQAGQRADVAAEICALVFCLINTVATYTVIVIACKRNSWSGLPIKVRLALIVLAIDAPGTAYFFANGLAQNYWDSELHLLAPRI